jgi:hypothetical protein
MQSWKLFAIVLPIFLLIDLLWLGVVMKAFYSQELGELARRQGAALAPRWGAAMLVYLLIPGGIVLFVRPLLGENGTAWQSFGWRRRSTRRINGGSAAINEVSESASATLRRRSQRSRFRQSQRVEGRKQRRGHAPTGPSEVRFRRGTHHGPTPPPGRGDSRI